MNGINLLLIQFKTCLKVLLLFYYNNCCYYFFSNWIWNLKQEEKISLAIANEDNGKYVKK
jgi:hypothetical protein